MALTGISPPFWRDAPLLVIAVALVSCSPEAPAPGWVHLADHEVLRSTTSGGDGWQVSLPGGREGRLVRDGAGVWLETEIREEDWELADGDPDLSDEVPEGAYRTRLLLLEVGRPEVEVPRKAVRVERGEPQRAVFAVPGWVFVLMPDGRSPGAATVRVCANVRDEGEGGRARVTGRSLAGDGFAVWAGERVEFELPEDAPRVLRFATGVEPAVETRGGRSVRFRVLVDGRTVLEHRQEVGRVGSLDRHGIALPAGGASRPRLAFEVDGDFAYASILEPVLGPPLSDSGSERPDLVVFLADTFRADNLGVYGGTHGMTPHLDRLASESLVFRRAWSVSTSTLPAHASLFSGLFPLQTGIRGGRSRLPRKLRTIAEHLAEYGYRTVAVTDAGFVSPSYGMDQGFELFHAVNWRVEGTSERLRTVLSEDDGRPLFLFVQSYRAHSPYRLSDGARARLEGSLAADVEFSQLMDGLQAEFGEEWNDADPGAPDFPAFQLAAGRLRQLYRGASSDLDELFGAFLGDLRELGVEDPFLLVTSDHGEGFAEHGRIFHSGRVFEEQVRIPLFISGPGIGAGVSNHAASLVDLPATLADLAGVPPHGDWLGTSLLRLDRDRPIFAFQALGKDDDRSSMGVVVGTQKFMVPELVRSPWEGPPQAAFELRSDPTESIDLSTSEEWPAEMLRVYGPVLEDMMRPRVGPEAASPDPERLEELRAMGYAGEVDDG